MKKLSLSLALVLGFGIFATTAPAQGFALRVPGEDRRQIRDNRIAAELDQLNRQVRQVRLEIGPTRSRYIRGEFARVVRATDRLNYAFRRGSYQRRQMWREIEEVRAELFRIRQELRFRGRRGIGPR